MIVILDFGSQYSQLIARAVRELGVFCKLLPYDAPLKKIMAASPKGIILSGSPDSITQKNAPQVPQAIFEQGCPILGICYGMQAMASQLGGTVETCEKREYGNAHARILRNCVLFKDLKTLNVWMSHGDHVTKLPRGFVAIARTQTCPIVAMADENRKFYGLQFHPEVTHTQSGKRILERFVKKVCDCQKTWTSHNIVENIIKDVRNRVGKDKVILGLSGGVDSSVVAALLHKAIGKQLTCIFIDTGLLRLGETKEVKHIFSKQMGIKLIILNAKQDFYHALKGIYDPEQKRKVIGKLFIRFFAKAASSIPNVRWLAQGTIYSDVIESASTKGNKSHTIKSHHNVGGLPKKLPFKLLEPIRELFKDEVRKIGIELGLPENLIQRHPFPGPGLAVRIIGEVKPEYVHILQQADAIFIEELHKHGYYQKVNQAFAVFLPVKSVGVIGDARNYAYVITLRAVETIDFMTAAWAKLPHRFLALVSNRIVNEIPFVARVTYDISSKPPATIEWE